MNTSTALPNGGASGESMHYAPIDDEPVITDTVIDRAEQPVKHLSPESVVSETAALDQRHAEEKEAMAAKKRLAINQILEGRHDRRQQIAQLEAKEDKDLETLGYEAPATTVFKSHEQRQIQQEATSIAAPKRRGRKPGSKNKPVASAEVSAAPKKKRGRPAKIASAIEPAKVKRAGKKRSPAQRKAMAEAQQRRRAEEAKAS